VKFNGFLGVPIAPLYFITAEHIGGTTKDKLYLHGEDYETVDFRLIPGTDLRVWKVKPEKPFPNYAPISTGVADVGAIATVFGRGTQRGTEVTVSGEAKGWLWGNADNVQRWGRNQVSSIETFQGVGQLLRCEFNRPGIADECHLSTGDSGGGVFVLENGLWRLAGINYAVEGPFQLPPSESSTLGAFFDKGGLKYEEPKDVWNPIPDTLEDKPTSFYSARVSASLAWLTTNVGPEVNSLATENFSAWQSLYFASTDISNPAIGGALADPDKDGIENLLEFALNLDPTFNERAPMIPTTGLRGLPAVRLENLSGDRLTVEFVRRTPASGAGLTYIAEFSTDLVTWQATGTEASTALNSRWDRVKITDTVTTIDEVLRFARLRVVISP